jgi:hypothetical protein
MIKRIAALAFAALFATAVAAPTSIQQQQAQLAPRKTPPPPSTEIVLDLTSYATITATIPSGNMAQPWAYDAEFITESTGLKALRFASNIHNQRLISWFMPIGSREEVWARYAVMIEDDVAAGFNELGMKLPGVGSLQERISLRMEHTPPRADGTYGFTSYWYDAESGSGYGVITPMGASFTPGRYYVIEQYVKLNTPGVADGIIRIRVDGRQTYERTDKLFRRNDQFQPVASTKLEDLHLNFYHGGMRMPKSVFHYRLAAVAVSFTGWPGVPSNIPVYTSPSRPPPKPAALAR